MFLHLDISANDVFVKGIRFVNNAGPDGGQAVALRVADDQIAIYQFSLLTVLGSKALGLNVLELQFAMLANHDQSV